MDESSVVPEDRRQPTWCRDRPVRPGAVVAGAGREAGPLWIRVLRVDTRLRGLPFMERRLALARTLLNPANSVLIVTIDEKEVH